MPNLIGINILDTAQLQPDSVLELVERLDMAQVTIVEATHQKEAFALARRLKDNRPQMDVFYRRWREKLPDERMPDMIRPDEFVEYMRDVMEAGLVACVYNEAQKDPMYPLTLYSRGIIDRTEHKGWATCHFKTATGTPKGYGGEKPDGYEQSDGVWIAASEANQSRIDHRQQPVVFMAPHAYFSIYHGRVGGHTDRPREILRRLKAIDIDPRTVPISIGETGVIDMRFDGLITDAEAGYVGLMGEASYADLFAQVAVSEFVPYRMTAHLFALGTDQADKPKWRRFDLLGKTAFWDRLEKLAKDGRFKPLPLTPSPLRGEGEQPAPVEIPRKDMTLKQVYREIAETHRKLAALYEQIADLTQPVKV